MEEDLPCLVRDVGEMKLRAQNSTPKWDVGTLVWLFICDPYRRPCSPFSDAARTPLYYFRPTVSRYLQRQLFARSFFLLSFGMDYISVVSSESVQLSHLLVDV